MKTLYRNTLLTLVIASLAACGGGGGSSGNNADNDRGSNNPGISSTETLQLLAEGLYEFDLYADDAPPYSVPTLVASRDRIGMENGLLKIDSHFTTPTGWMTESEYYDLIGSTESRDLILTADGWRERATISCPVQAEGNVIVLDCAGNLSRMTLGTPRALGGASLVSELMTIAANALAPLDIGSINGNAYAALQNTIAALPTLFDSQARVYPVASVIEYAEAVTLDCAPTAADQPESEWSCDTSITSTSWEELDTQNEAFSFYFTDASDNFRSMRVYLDGNLVAASSGNIVLVEDNDEELTPGSVIGTWNKVRIHGQDIIALKATGQSDAAGNLNALFVVNDQIVMGIYNPAGARYTGALYNASAGSALSDAAETLLPLSFDE
jgi:hypothetical protein